MEPDLSPRLIDLALEEAFEVAGLEVRPATLEVLAGDRREQLEPRIMQVLVALARRRGEVVSRDELIQTCWGGRVVGEDSINRCIFRLRKLAKSLGGGFEIVTVPRVGFRLTEHPAQGARRRRHLRPILFAAAVLAIAAIGALLAISQWPSDPPERLRVAVEPVRIASLDPADRALASALTDDILTQVAASGVELAGNPPHGRSDYRLVSTLAPEGGRVRLSLGLIDEPQGAQVWSTEIAGLPAEVRQRAAVTGAGATRCVGRARAPRAGPVSPQALTDYVRACVLGEDAESATEVYALLQRVTIRAPRFSVGHASLALYAAIAAKDVNEPLKTSLKRKGQSEADTALRLNPAEGTAFVAREMLVEPRTQWMMRAKFLEQGLAVDPENFELLSRLGIVFAASGRLSEAEVFHRRAVTLNPFSANSAAELAVTMDSRTSIRSARIVIDDAYRRWPENPQIRALRFEIEALHGDPQKAIAMFHEPEFAALVSSPEHRATLELALAARASGSPAQLAHARQAVTNARLWPPLTVQVLAVLGDVDGALRVAEAAATTHPDYEPMYLFRASTRPMRNDPRFMRVAKKWGLIEYWRKSGRWPDFCSDPSLPYDCRKEAELLS